MAEIVLIVMGVAATLYAVLAGADFGAGLIEAFLPREEQDRVEVALAPVWEANHVWLVLVVVLAFVGFPSLYTVVTTYLHIPLLGVLLGIVARGAAFTFRHYDPEPSGLGWWYSFAFRVGSLLTPLCIGLIMASIASGTLATLDSLESLRSPGSPAAQAELGFYEVFIAPFNTWFAWMTGLFVCTLFAFQGAALLAAENATRAAPLPYLRIARYAHLAAMLSGGLVFLSAYLENLPWFYGMLASPLSLGCMLLATLLIPVVARAFQRGLPWTLRLATGAQVSAILVGFFAAQFPVLVRIAPVNVTFPKAAAPAPMLAQLIVALVVGLALIVPSTVYLIRIYKRRPDPA